jgi:hypothetical protein
MAREINANFGIAHVPQNAYPLVETRECSTCP